MIRLTRRPQRAETGRNAWAAVGQKRSSKHVRCATRIDATTCVTIRDRPMAAGNEAGTGVSAWLRHQRRQYWHGGFVLALPRARTGLLLRGRRKISGFRFALGLLVQRTRLASRSYGHSRGVHHDELRAKDTVSGLVGSSAEGGRKVYDVGFFP
jgi:hypothetical protein